LDLIIHAYQGLKNLAAFSQSPEMALFEQQWVDPKVEYA
jgi:hypothetical protein